MFHWGMEGKTDGDICVVTGDEGTIVEIDPVSGTQTVLTTEETVLTSRSRHGFIVDSQAFQQLHVYGNMGLNCLPLNQELFQIQRQSEEKTGG